MSIDFSVLIWTIITFLLLMVLLHFTLFRPLRSFMAKRQQEIDAGVEAGEQAQEALEAQKTRQQAELAEQALLIDRVRQENAGSLTAFREQAQTQAIRDAEQQREVFQARLAREEEALAAGLEQDTEGWVALLAEKLFAHKPEEGRN